MAAKVVITERQQMVLQTMAFSRSCPQGLAHRAEIILLAFEGLKNEEIAQKLNCERHGVGTWRRRWQRAFDKLTVIECLEKPPALREAIAEVLGDLPRAGCGGTFTAEQIAQIIAVACEPPEKSGRPVTHWTPRELTDEVIKRGIATSISVRHVGRFLKDSGTSASPMSVLAHRQSEGRSGLRAASA
jgi:putative transposase